MHHCRYVVFVDEVVLDWLKLSFRALDLKQVFIYFPLPLSAILLLEEQDCVQV